MKETFEHVCARCSEQPTCKLAVIIGEGVYDEYVQTTIAEDEGIDWDFKPYVVIESCSKFKEGRHG